MSSVHRWGWGRPWTLPLLGGRSNPSLASLPDPLRIFSRALESRERTARRWAGLDLRRPVQPHPRVGEAFPCGSARDLAPCPGRGQGHCGQEGRVGGTEVIQGPCWYGDPTPSALLPDMRQKCVF